MAGAEHGIRLEPEKQNLLNQHTEKHFTAGDVVRDIIIGVSDGLTVPFALAAGLSGANATSAIILTAGIAEVAAGAISMGLGGYNHFSLKVFLIFFLSNQTVQISNIALCRYLAAKSEADHYARELRREQEEIISVPDTGM